MQFTGKRYLDYSSFIKLHFGERVQKISLDIGFSCPNRDGFVALSFWISWTRNTSDHKNGEEVCWEGDAWISPKNKDCQGTVCSAFSLSRWLFPLTFYSHSTEKTQRNEEGLFWIHGIYEAESCTNASRPCLEHVPGMSAYLISMHINVFRKS